MNKEDVQHIINFLRDNEIETGHKRGVEPLEEMLKENEELKKVKITKVYLKGVNDNEKIWQDKIRNKIKELTKEKDKLEFEDFITIDKILAIIDVLEDLL